MRFRVTCQGLFESTTGSIDDDAINALHAAMAELNTHGTAPGNAAAHLDRATGELIISCTVEVAALGLASQPASDSIYLSLNSAGIATPDWPLAEDAVWKVELTRSNSELLTSVP